MIPTINILIRVTRNRATAIDSNTVISANHHRSAIIKGDISDHFLIVFAFNTYEGFFNTVFENYDKYLPKV